MAPTLTAFAAVDSEVRFTSLALTSFGADLTACQWHAGRNGVGPLILSWLRPHTVCLPDKLVAGITGLAARDNVGTEKYSLNPLYTCAPPAVPGRGR